MRGEVGTGVREVGRGERYRDEDRRGDEDRERG